VNVDFFTPQTVNEETLNQNDQFLAGRFKSVSLISKETCLVVFRNFNLEIL